MRVRRLKISTGGTFVVLMNEADASSLALHKGDRVNLIRRNGDSVTAVLDITPNHIRRGQIGLFDEVFTSLKFKEGESVSVAPSEKPVSLSYIKKKLDGFELSREEITQIVEDITNDKLLDMEIAYFVSACYSNHMSLRETRYLTEAMISTGDILKINSRVVADKHCIGGVAGNRTTMVIVPIVSSLGIVIPKTSSRAITSPAGTADTVEVLTHVEFSLDDLKRFIRKSNAFMVWGGSVNLAPADDRIIKVERPLSVDSEGQLLASILAKKKSVSSNHVLIDIPLGRGAKIESRLKAIRLKHKFEVLGKMLDMKIRVIITDGSQPIGRGIGPVLEARDVLWLFERDHRRPLDLEQKGLLMSAHLINMTKRVSFDQALKLAKQSLESGRAREQFLTILKNQGAKITHSSEIELARFKAIVRANKSGRIVSINNRTISLIARFAGAPFDKKAGVYLLKKKLDRVVSGDILYEIYAESNSKLRYAKEFAEQNSGYLIK